MTNTLRNLLVLIFSCGLFFSGKSQVQVVSPNGGEIWYAGSPVLVSFNNSGAEDWFIIEQSTDNGATWVELDYAYGFTGLNEIFTYTTFEESTEAKIRVSNYYIPGISDESDTVFSIVVPAYFIYSPMQGDSYFEGQDIYVQWNTSSLNPVNIEFSSDNGNTWTLVGSDVTMYYYSFSAPQNVSDQCVLRLSDATDPAVFSLSGTFSIIPAPSISLVTPNGGEVWNYGEEYEVSWTGEGLDYYVIIEFSGDGGNTWQQMTYAETSPTGGSAMVSPLLYPTTNARIRVVDYYSGASDESDADFTVNSPAYLVSAPYLNSAFYVNGDVTVQWYSYLTSNVDIQFSSDNGATFTTVLTDIPAYQQYVNFPAPEQPSDNCIVKVVSTGDPQLFGLSQAFRVVPMPELTLTFPNGGEILDNDSTYQITWSLTGELLYYSYGTIEFSMDNGATWQYIGWTYDLQSQNFIDWKTPVQTSDQCLVRVSDYYNSFPAAVSQSTFSIKDFPKLEICMVSVDSASGKNVIVWNKVQSDLIAEYVVLKESNIANEYIEVGSVTANAVSVITDENSNPAEKATRYKLTFRDSDNNLYPTGSLHQTIHLSINKGVGANWNLYWNSYLGFPISSYNIYRGTNPGDLQLIGTVSGNFTTYTDQNAPAGYVYYMVEVVNPNQCDPEGGRSSFYGSSKSNIATNNTLGLGEKNQIEGLTAYPNPATDIIRIKTSADIKGNVTISLISASGQIIRVYDVNSTTLIGGMEIETLNLAEGIYTLLLMNEQKSATIRFIKQE